ncbi:hypothetical protein SDC9_127258 [bioreactor metagenome]|uniref:Uncharacterized protein n=1 Tax=bioreactor metagenome TaxID=1076179 RepID=A0A645CTI0_9ZZZZ
MINNFPDIAQVPAGKRPVENFCHFSQNCLQPGIRDRYRLVRILRLEGYLHVKYLPELEILLTQLRIAGFDWRVILDGVARQFQDIELLHPGKRGQVSDIVIVKLQAVQTRKARQRADILDAAPAQEQAAQAGQPRQRAEIFDGAVVQPQDP